MASDKHFLYHLIIRFVKIGEMIKIDFVTFTTGMELLLSLCKFC